MKKTLISSSILFLLCVFLIPSCSKQVQSEDNHVEKDLMRTQSINNITVSSYGFLILPASNDVEEFLNYVIGETHGDVQDYLSGMSFTSQGATLYGSTYQNQTVTEEQAVNYLLSADGIVQVEDIIFKPIIPVSCEKPFWKYVLTMMETALSSVTYENLASGIYDSQNMNKIATNDSTQTEALEDFVKHTPDGYESPNASVCPETLEDPGDGGRPMFGWKCYNQYVTTVDNCAITKCESRRKYFFWILVKERTDVEVGRVCT